jgi:hypothetical protein
MNSKPFPIDGINAEKNTFFSHQNPGDPKMIPHKKKSTRNKLSKIALIFLSFHLMSAFLFWGYFAYLFTSLWLNGTDILIINLNDLTWFGGIYGEMILVVIFFILAIISTGYILHLIIGNKLVERE